jgi:branched-chain amino acid transport system permease protein
MYWESVKFDKRTITAAAVIAVALIIYPNIQFNMSGYILSVMTQALLFIYLANSWNILSGLTGMFSLGHAAFFGIGAYSCAIAMVQIKALSGMGLITRYVIGIIIGIICSGIFSLVIAYIATKLKGLFFAMTTLALAEVLRTFALQANITNGNIGIIVPKEFSVSPIASYYIILVMCGLAFLFTWFLKNSRIGRMFISIRENENLAASLGVNITKWIYVSVFISATLACLGGAYYPLYLSHIEPTSTFDYAITMQMIIVCIAGGRGTVPGPLIGGIVVLLNEGIRAVLTKFSSGATSFASLAGIFYGVMLLLIVLFLSDGLIALPAKFRASKEKREKRHNSAKVRVNP